MFFVLFCFSLVFLWCSFRPKHPLPLENLWRLGEMAALSLGPRSKKRDSGGVDFLGILCGLRKWDLLDLISYFFIQHPLRGPFWRFLAS